MTVISKYPKLPRTAWVQLFQGARQGSKRALNRLFEITEPRIRSMANFVGTNSLAKQDLYTRGCETLVEVINNDVKVKNPENYIFKTIRLEMKRARMNAAIHAKRFISIDTNDIYQSLNANRIVTQAPDRHISRNPHKMTVISEILERVKRLSPKKREIFMAKIFEEEESASIGKRLHLLPNTVDKIFERVKKELGKWARAQKDILQDGQVVDRLEIKSNQ